MTVQLLTPFKHRLALIIPTRNRPKLLIKLLQTIQTQSVKPAQVIIVDGSDEPIQQKITGYLSEDDTYIHVFPPSLTKQKNEGIKQLRDDITLAGYLDDDIELEPGSIEEMLRFWEQCSSDVGGAEFNIINVPERKQYSWVIERILYPNPSFGKVFRSGICTAAWLANQNISCEWLCGGATIWKREILENYKYDEFYSGWATHEDVEFSYRVSKKYRLYFVHLAKVIHNSPPLNPKNAVAFYRMSVINRYYFVKKNPELSVWCFYWGTIREIFVTILISVWKRNREGFRVVQGNVSGLSHIILGKLVQADKNYRE